MNRTLFLALVIPLIAAAYSAQFLLHDHELGTVAALLALAVTAIRWALGPQTADEQECPADCPKCAESQSTDPEFDSFAWEHGDFKRGEEL